jgi:hypothetical protein
MTCPPSFAADAPGVFSAGRNLLGCVDTEENHRADFNLCQSLVVGQFELTVKFMAWV